MISQLTLGLIAALCTGAALVQTATAQVSASSASTAAPVAYVYVSSTNPNEVHALSASLDGTLTQVGSVPSQNAIYHLSVNKKFLFGIDIESNIYTYTIASKGALKQVAVTAAGKYVPDFDPAVGAGLLQIDETGSSLYAFMFDKELNTYLASFKIEDNGGLEFLGLADANNAGGQIRVVQNNQFALSSGCAVQVLSSTLAVITGDIGEFRRESNGYLTLVGTSHDVPQAQSPYQWCPTGGTASDSTGNIAVGLNLFQPDQNYNLSQYALAAYTVNAQGNLSTPSTRGNMASSAIEPDVMSISPSGKLLAVGGNGYYQFFHFNGANPITKYTGLFNEEDQVREFGWDKSDHFYLLSGHSLESYDITPTSYKKLAPLPISAPYSMIVLSLQ